MQLRDEMPEFLGATAWLNGEVTKKKLIYKPTLVHFWSVSCDECKDVFSQIDDFRDNFKDELNIVAVHIPSSEGDKNLEQIEKTVKEMKMTEPVFIDNDLKLAHAFENESVPAYFVFDMKGELRHFQTAKLDEDNLRREVKKILKEMKREIEN